MSSDGQGSGLHTADFENIFAWISDSKRDFNRFPDPAIAVDCGFIYFLGPVFGLCVLLKIFRTQGENVRADLVNKS